MTHFDGNRDNVISLQEFMAGETCCFSHFFAREVTLSLLNVFDLQLAKSTDQRKIGGAPCLLHLSCRQLLKQKVHSPVSIVLKLYSVA